MRGETFAVADVPPSFREPCVAIVGSVAPPFGPDRAASCLVRAIHLARRLPTTGLSTAPVVPQEGLPFAITNAIGRRA